MSVYRARTWRVVLLVVVDVLLGGPPTLEQPVNLVGLRVAPLAHPVLEAREQNHWNRVRRGGGDRPGDDLGVGRDERGLRRDRRCGELYGLSIRAWHGRRLPMRLRTQTIVRFWYRR